MPRPKNPKLRGTPPPRSFEDVIGVLFPIPNFDTPTVGGRPVEKIADKPDVWQNVRRGKAGKFT